MAVTYYGALPFIRTEDGTAPGEAQECQSEAAAIRRAEGMSRDPANAGAVAFKRAGDPNVGEFSDAVVLKKFGDVLEDLSELIRSCCFVITGMAAAGFAVVVARSLSARQFPRLRPFRRVLPRCSDSVARWEQIADAADAHSKQRF